MTKQSREISSLRSVHPCSNSHRTVIPGELAANHQNNDNQHSFQASSFTIQNLPISIAVFAPNHILPWPFSSTNYTMTDYNALKVPELKKLLTDRSLPVSGNKADLIARLQENDKKPDAAAGVY